MSQVVEFLREAKVFYLATVDGNEARLRPINSVIDYNGKVYFETSKKKQMYHQMLANPHVSIVGMANGRWIRITGKAVFDESPEMKQEMFDQLPALKPVYTFEELVTYFLEDMKATINKSGEAPIELL